MRKLTLFWSDEILEALGIDKGDELDICLHLQNLGLVNFMGAGGFKIEARNAENKLVSLWYFGQVLQIKTEQNQWTASTGKVILTRAGSEIATCLKLEGSESVRDAIISHIIRQDLTVNTPIPLITHPSSTPK